MLKSMGKDRGAGDRTLKTLKDTLKDKDDKLGRAAYEALKSLNAAKGLKMPAEEKKPVMITSQVDNAEMMLIPAGTFLYGSKEENQNARSNEKPQRVIDLPAFYMDKYPVNNRQYCEFLNSVRSDEDRLSEWMYLSGSFEGVSCRIGREKDTIQDGSFHNLKNFPKAKSSDLVNKLLKLGYLLDSNRGQNIGNGVME